MNARTLYLATGLLLASAGIGAAQSDSSTMVVGDDPFLGTWILKVNASHYADGTTPLSMVITMDADPGGVRYRSRSMLADRHIVTAEYVASYDRGIALVIGESGMLAPVSLRRIDPTHIDVSYYSGFQVVATSRRALLPGGRTMSITTSFKDHSGIARTNIGIYERAAPRPA